MKALLVDDEPLARSRLKRLLTKFPNIHVIGEAADGISALEKIHELNIDVVFLDIEMPGLNGLKIAESLSELAKKPAIIYTTAHPEHALDAYLSGPLDYLVKPIDPIRLEVTIERLLKESHQPSANPTDEPAISIQLGNIKQRIFLRDILFFQSEDKYVRIVHVDGEALTEKSLTQIESEFTNKVLRIHRSILINPRHLIAIERKEDGHHIVKLQGTHECLSISRRLLPQVKAFMD